MSFVVDLSSGFATITGADLLRIGASGWIAYTGCDNTAKNISKPKFQEYCDTGLPGALVIENGTQDVLGGEKAGASLAQHIMAGAEALGYDVANCALATSADFNETTLTQYTETVDCMGAFGALVPVPVYYGDGDSADRVIPATRCIYSWQSDSTSFSPGGTSPYARLQQRYADARAQGLPVDVNDVLGAPLHFMGEPVTTPAQDASAVWGEVIQVPMLQAPGQPVPADTAGDLLATIRGMLGQIEAMLNTAATTGATYQAAVLEAIAAIQPGGAPSAGLTADQVTALIDTQLTGRVINIIVAANIGDIPAPTTSAPEGAPA